ncbi:UdgX family uracil-DNA binding protein [Amaricoccus solimangrovi]|uniref:Type-4 uracil-DNA glycosylase n=1 Tax=Amaricoccus solimangrovi TaxID=2589815 RepID=A0A501WZE0_9RHOB|nr:UdgX family uracil-DNA binding protein [Amaricoccus solimangrovi]TPE53735.1 UdgX family uracil-DNA binding protein [Amaricoccus solimangrovi]
MRSVALRAGANLAGFRAALRALMAEGVPPAEVVWQEEGAPADLHARPLVPHPEAPAVPLPRAAVDLIATVVMHRAPERYARLHDLCWRLTHGEAALLDDPSDPLVHRLGAMAREIRREIHKMHAFVRFRRVEEAGLERYVAWFEPEHFILEAAAPFFRDRFRALDWTILTPVGSVRWNGESLAFGPPATRDEAPAGDPVEAAWTGYYAATFNPARVNPARMRQEMPRRYWRDLPEAATIPGLIAEAPARAREMIEKEAEMPRKRDPARAVAAMAEQRPASLAELNAIIARSDPFVEGGTRAVLGEGPDHAAIAFVGEQPGDQEDSQGRPFVGPAGQLLDRALAEAGIGRAACYLTNAVKHFKFRQTGKRRLHQTPTAGEVRHYRWWLETELDLVAPRLTVALGATAALALAGRAVPVTKNRGPWRFGDRPGYLTVHPSYLLRLPDAEAKAREYARFVEDLRAARALAA